MALLSAALMAATGFGQTGETVEARLDGDTVRIINRGARENCAASFLVTVRVDGMTVRVIECDTSTEKAFCICNFDFEASVGGLAQGQYTAEIYREYRKRSLYPRDTVVLIGTVPFTVASPPGSPFVHGKASPCYDVAEVPAGFSPAVPPVDVIVRPSSRDIVIAFSLESPGRTEILVFDALVRFVRTLFEGDLQEGPHECAVGISLLPSSGTYYIVVRSAGLIGTASFQAVK
ncbi:MAG: hypothetical protein QHI48_08420 [Bacteroidota bacterium]|nr:hypothetical protein [Bacteroidota bacterium]